MNGVLISDEILQDNNLEFREKLLLSSIIQESKEEGYCTANNNFFGKKILLRSKRTITRLLASLIDKSYIKMENKRSRNRKIYILHRQGDVYVESDQHRQNGSQHRQGGVQVESDQHRQNGSQHRQNWKSCSSYNISNINNKNLLPVIINEVYDMKKNSISKKLKTKNIDPPKKLIVVPPTVQEFIDYWNNKELRRTRSTTSKSFEDNVIFIKKLRTGKMYSDNQVFSEYATTRFSLSDWIKAVNNFQTALTDSNVFPIKKKVLKNIGIKDFIWTPFGKTIMGKSNFIHYLNNEPDYVVHKQKDLFPTITENIKKAYRQVILGDLQTEYTTRDVNDFILTARKLKMFLVKNRSKMNYTALTDGNEETMLCKAVKQYCGDNYLTPKVLNNDIVFNNWLPKYLKQEEIV